MREGEQERRIGMEEEKRETSRGGGRKGDSFGERKGEEEGKIVHSIYRI